MLILSVFRHSVTLDTSCLPVREFWASHPWNKVESLDGARFKIQTGIWAGRDKFVRVDAYPTGIDAEGITTMITKDTFRERTNKLRESFGGKKVIVCR